MPNPAQMPELTKEQVYDQQIAPLIDKAMEIAAKHQIPFLAVGEVKHDPQKGYAFTSSVAFHGNTSMRMAVAAALVNDRIAVQMGEKLPVRGIEVVMDAYSDACRKRGPLPRIVS